MEFAFTPFPFSRRRGNDARIAAFLIVVRLGFIRSADSVPALC
jgi:hypothetical protein